jgi:hypothetical protein
LEYRLIPEAPAVSPTHAAMALYAEENSSGGLDMLLQWRKDLVPDDKIFYFIDLFRAGTKLVADQENKSAGKMICRMHRYASRRNNNTYTK